MTKTFQAEALFEFSNFGHWNLFDIWNLTFVISTSECNPNNANPIWGSPKPAPLGLDISSITIK